MDQIIVQELAGYPNKSYAVLYALVSGCHNLLRAAAIDARLSVYKELQNLSDFAEQFAAAHDQLLTGRIYARSNTIDDTIAHHFHVISAIWIGAEVIELMVQLELLQDVAEFSNLVIGVLAKFHEAWPSLGSRVIHRVDITYQQRLEEGSVNLKVLGTQYDYFLSILGV